MTAMVMATVPSGLDRIEVDGRSARAGSIGLDPEDVNMDVKPLVDIAIIGFEKVWPARFQLTTIGKGQPIEPQVQDVKNN